MKFWASFILACLALATAFLAIFEGSVAAVFNFGSKYIEIAGQLESQAQQRIPYQPPPTQTAYRPPPTQPVPYRPAAPPPARAVSFQITNGLSEGQISEVTRVSMGDPHQSVGQFTLTPLQPTGTLTVNAESGPGSYRYSLETDVVIAADNGNRRLLCRGEGVVIVRANSTFSVHLLSHDPVTDECVVGLR